MRTGYFLDSVTMFQTKKQDRPPPSAVPFSKTDSQRAAYPSTLTLDSDSTAANHPKVVAGMTLGTCTPEMVWIRLRDGMEIQDGTWPYADRGIRGSRERRSAVDELLSVCRKPSPRLQAPFFVGRQNSMTRPLCSGETHFTLFKNLVGM
jgi:hypothetical protein